MQQFLFFLRGTIFAILFVLNHFCSISQTQQAPKIQSPNAATLGMFGDIPLSLYTGAPNISIPIHTLTYGKIQVPIALRYHPSSVRPAQQPGWVGLGWDLQCTGSISRKVRGHPDEEYYPG
jgi:hypothetical protein